MWQGCTCECCAKICLCRVPTEGTKHLWEQGHLLNIPQHSSQHSRVTAEAGQRPEPVLQPEQELRALGHPMTVTTCPLRGGGQAQPPQWSTWEAHPRRSQLQSRAMFYVPLQHHSALFCFCSQYYPLSKRLTDAYSKRHPGLFRGWTPNANPSPNLFHPLQDASWPAASTRVPPPAPFVNIRKSPGIKLKARPRSVCCNHAGSRHIQFQQSISAIPALTPKLKTKLEIRSDLPKFWIQPVLSYSSGLILHAGDTSPRWYQHGDSSPRSSCKHTHMKCKQGCLLSIPRIRSQHPRGKC